MSKVRVYEVAKDLNMDNKALVALFQAIGITDVRNHMSSVGPEQVERVKRHLEKQSSQKVVEERIHATVVKRRAVRRPGTEASSPAAAPPPSQVATEAPVSHSAPSVVEEALPPVPPEPVIQAALEPKSSPRSAPRAAEPPLRSEPRAAAPAEAPSSPVAPPPSMQAAPSPSPATLPAVSPPSSPAAAPPPPAAATAASPPPPPAPAEARLTPAPAPPSVPAAPAPERPAAAIAAAPAAASVGASSVPASRSVASQASAAGPGRASHAGAGMEPRRPTAAPKTGVEVWGGRPGVPMPQPPRTAPAPRRVQYDAKAGTAGGIGQRRGPGGPMMGRGGPGQRGGRRGPMGGPQLQKRPAGTSVSTTQERSAHKKVVKIEETIQLQSLAGKIGVKATDLLMKLMQLGMMGVNINSTLDADTAKIVANEFGWEIADVAVSEEQALEAAQGVGKEEATEGREPRPPVVTVMGHVDHGKTSLLDALRKSNVVAAEAGGITQHIGAYSVETPRGKVTFLDTPGHEAFTQMRARGAQATDVVILVVAADDGVMPQTKEAVSHARAAKVPIVVAVNKIDKPQAQPERVRRELSEIGLVPEEWGGDTLFCEVSATTKQGIEHLLESVALQAELLDLKADENKPASGLVIEAQLDRGRGPVATVLVTEGTLKRGDTIIAGSTWGKVRAMIDDRGRSVATAGPSMPVAIIGLGDVPSAGDPVHSVKDSKIAQSITETRKSKERKSLLPSTTKVSLEELAKAMSEASQLDLKVIVKADVQGSVEALGDALARLSTDKVKVTVVHAAVGAITEGDVNLAVAAKALIIGFNVRPAGKASVLAQKEGIQIRQYAIIYEVVDDVKRAMEGLLEPTRVEKHIGRAEVRQLFKVGKSGWVAGCMVIEGVIKRAGGARIARDGAVLWEGKLASLKRFKDDVREVREGFDCGMAFEGFNDVKEGDLVEAFEIEEVRQTL